MHDSIIIPLSFWYIVHSYSAMDGSLRLHSNQFCKTCQNCFCPSWRCLCCEATIRAFAMHCELGRRQFWHALQKLLLSSHPWPNMNDQCTIWKKTNMLFSTWLITIVWFFFSILRDVGLNLGFLYFKSHCIRKITFTSSNFGAIMYVYKRVVLIIVLYHACLRRCFSRTD